jgi:molybdate transport system substrate-binding protein
VFAASSLEQALDAAIAHYRPPGGAPVQAAYAASSTLARQIEQGAEADVLITASVSWMDYAARRGLIRAASRSVFAGNALVLIAPAPSALRLRIAPGFDLAGALGDGRLAMGDPDHVPAGIYGLEALHHFGVGAAVGDRLARAASVRGALALVARGECPLGIVYRSDAAAEPAVRVLDTFPPASHAPIVYPMAITAASTHPQADTFAAFLRSPPARRALARHGFTTEP